MDMLVKLYNLPPLEPVLNKMVKQTINVRRARSYEKPDVIDWVAAHFSRSWMGECDTAFGHEPISCYIATRNGEIIGFACYNCTAKNFFGPTGVDENVRGHGIGRALLLSCLHTMAEDGYAYAIIGGIGPAEFYQKTVGATLIEGSTPGIYIDRLIKK